MFNFFRKRTKTTADKPVRDIAELTAALALPGLHIIKDSNRSKSHLGGSPNLPPNVIWPERNGKRLGFLARLSLSEIHSVLPISWLPAEGALLFFYDMEECPWGFSPEDRGGCAVLHVPDLPEPTYQPAEPDNSDVITRATVKFKMISTFPDNRESVTALHLSDTEFTEYSEIRSEVWGDLPNHQLGGFPAPVQSDDMELECQLVSNGLNCGDSSGYKSEKAKSLEQHKDRWKLLFQFDTNDDLDIMWGDCGTIYFWVPEEEAIAGDFSNVWLILQCC